MFLLYTWFRIYLLFLFIQTFLLVFLVLYFQTQSTDPLSRFSLIYLSLEHNLPLNLRELTIKLKRNTLLLLHLISRSFILNLSQHFNYYEFVFLQNDCPMFFTMFQNFSSTKYHFSVVQLCQVVQLAPWGSYKH